MKRILAHHTLYCGTYYAMHCITFSSQGIVLSPYDHETEATEFIDGIVIIGNDRLTDFQKELEDMLCDCECHDNDIIPQIIRFITKNNLECNASSTPSILNFFSGNIRLINSIT